MKLGCGFYGHVGRAPLPQAPHLPGPEPIRAPAQPGEQGEELLVAVARFPSGEFRGVLWDARIESLSIRDRRAGPNTITISAPTTPQTMAILGDALGSEVDQFGRPLGHVKNAISCELLVGSTVDHLVRWRFVVRDLMEVADGRVTATATGWVGGLTSDRIIGAPTRLNRLGDRLGSFEAGNLSGWRKVGGAQAGVVSGGVDGGFAAWVQGTPGSAWIEARIPYSQPERPWGRQRIAGTAYVKLPKGEDIEDYGLVSIGVVSGGQVVWPDPRRGDPDAGVVTSDMARGQWVRDPVVGIGYLPTPPYVAEVVIRLHATSATKRTYYDGAEIVLRENSSTEFPRDLTLHVDKLFDHAQRGRDKSPWGIGVVQGTPHGTSEVGTWWHEDGQSMNDAIEALCGRGMDVHDLAGPGRRVMATKRRGSVRNDLRLNPWDILGTIKWRVDPGAQRTAVRAVSAAGSIWGGADEGAIDTSQSGGQILDVTISGPVGMTPTQLRAWALDQLATMSLLQATMTVLVPWALGMRLMVGDSVMVAAQDGSAAHLDWMRVTGWTPESGRRFIAVDLGTDPDLGGH